ncbi:hypothetical protein [Tenacibaculum finnmarkense]|uniref:hypothetical protein n=1 Tax=Tenacibaculum finnmarkense TaxID=2781243 RepID=UPI0007393FEF|nr:hypothetical protein [Tenacibaculum finnmarkense]ALU74952.1 hypothetical protein AUW17_06625 [Tenacibaculum dicentrarchi]MBE7660774.1 hypothetical protein [Tenacibaculum finnmarkense genomovar finnmarkense]MBE7692627.1 hypothetical protein [Tenacibaculum finnmarkense genomovar finnmarkense]MCD8402969.1 hypothetical protein [Tenacibaculum finnmarkense genomovar finnmarkense]MCD8412882.1 hypothetical protein [Tenacibaculum finnmarkense genomovar ulcerans]
MKKIIYITLCLLLASCTKSIDITYKQSETINNNEAEDSNSLVGVWDGVESCTICCGTKFRFTLTITKHENEFLEGTLKEADIPDQQYFAIFKANMNLEDNKLTITTNGVLETVDDKPGCGPYCTGNTYELILSPDRKKLDGVWLKSNECTVSATSINLEKQ